MLDDVHRNLRLYPFERRPLGPRLLEFARLRPGKRSARATALLDKTGRPGRQLDVALGDPAGCVCRPAQRNLVPVHGDVRMVGLLGDLGDPFTK